MYTITHRSKALDVGNDQNLVAALIPASDLESGDTLIANLALSVSNDSGEIGTITFDVYFGAEKATLTLGTGIVDGLSAEPLFVTIKAMRVGDDLWVFDPTAIAGYGASEQLGHTDPLPADGNVQVIADAGFTTAKEFAVRANISGDIDETCIVEVLAVKVIKQ